MVQQDFTKAVWRKSTRCQDGDSCVEVARLGELVGVRDSEDCECEHILVFDQSHWREFVAFTRASSRRLLFCCESTANRVRRGASARPRSALTATWCRRRNCDRHRTQSCLDLEDLNRAPFLACSGSVIYLVGADVLSQST
jgi:hypothetical protein